MLNNNTINSFYILFSVLSLSKKKQLIQLFFLMIAGGIAEVVSIGIIIPFLSIMLSPNEFQDIFAMSWLVELLNLDNKEKFYWIATVLFSILIVFTGILRFFLAMVTAKFNFGIGHELGLVIYERSLYRPYEEYVTENSSEVIGGLNKLEQLIWVIFGMLNTVSALVILFFIIATIILIEPILSVFVLFGLGGVYAFFLLIFKKRLDENSKSISMFINKRMQIVQEGLGSMRDIILRHNQKIFIDHFFTIDQKIRKAQTSNNIISPIPRFAIESLIIVLIAFFAYREVEYGNNLAHMLPILGALTLGLQKSMPLAQQAYLGWSQFNGNKELLHDVASIISKPVNRASFKEESLVFKKKISFNNVSFSYKNSQYGALDKINFTINKGSIIGITGPTGSGKSTIVDLLMCLLKPSTGGVLVDDICLSNRNCVYWQKNISHVPQNVYLLDSTFAENIAFGLTEEKIDISRVKWAAEKAQASGFIEGSADGYYSMVGEGGRLISGGQRQRIGIARALYSNKSSVLVFDEATSALNVEIERKIMSSIASSNPDMTIIIISHRASIFEYCDWIYKVNNGSIVEEGRPDNMMLAHV